MIVHSYRLVLFLRTLFKGSRRCEGKCEYCWINRKKDQQRSDTDANNRAWLISSNDKLEQRKCRILKIARVAINISEKWEAFAWSGIIVFYY